MYRKKLNKFKIIIIFGGSSRSARLHGQKRKRTKWKSLLFHFASQSPELHIAKAERPEASLQHVFVSVHKREWVSVFVCRSLARRKICEGRKFSLVRNFNETDEKKNKEKTWVCWVWSNEWNKVWNKRKKILYTIIAVVVVFHSLRSLSTNTRMCAKARVKERVSNG